MTCNILEQGLGVLVGTVAPNTSFSAVTSGVGAVKTIAINANAAGIWLFRIQLVDSLSAPNIPTLDVPSVTNETIIERYTDPDGTLTVEVEHAGSTKTWYPLITLIGKARADAADALIYT